MAFIVRIDSERTRGWQVRGSGSRGYYSKLFSDRVYGGREEAKAEAEAYKEEVEWKYPPQRPQAPPYFSRPPQHNTSGVLGVYRSHSYHASGLKQEFWAAFCPTGPTGQRYLKRFYINDERDEDEAFRLAVEFRQMWEEAVSNGEAALRRFWDEVESGWL